MKSKVIGAFEITSNSVKLVVGYLYDKEMIILAAAKTPLEIDVINDGIIKDFNAVSKAIATVQKEIINKTDVQISQYVVIIPPIGFEVYENRGETFIISSDDIITELDVDNVLNQVSKAKTSEGCQTINVIPEYYQLDCGQMFPQPPIGQKSKSLSVKVRLHSCPTYLVSAYKKAFTQANIQFSKMYVAPDCALALINDLQNVPNDFLLIDLGARITSVSLIGNHKIISSTFVYQGLDNVGDSLASNFHIDVSLAQQLKEILGLDHQSPEFKAPLFKVKGSESSKIYSVEDFKEAVGLLINDYVKEISEAVKELASKYDPNIVKLPVILVGGGTRFNGLYETLKGYLNIDDLRVYAPRTIGARHPQYINCVGALRIICEKNIVKDEIETSEEETTSSRTRRIKINRDSFED